MNVLKVAGLFIALGFASYTFVWLASQLRKEISVELKEIK